MAYIKSSNNETDINEDEKMNNKEFRALKNGTKSEIINGITGEILDTVKQGGITKMSEIEPNVKIMLKELFGEVKKVLMSDIMNAADKKLIVSVR